MSDRIGGVTAQLMHHAAVERAVTLIEGVPCAAGPYPSSECRTPSGLASLTCRSALEDRALTVGAGLSVDFGIGGVHPKQERDPDGLRAHTGGRRAWLRLYGYGIALPRRGSLALTLGDGLRVQLHSLVGRDGPLDLSELISGSTRTGGCSPCSRSGTERP